MVKQCSLHWLMNAIRLNVGIMKRKMVHKGLNNIKVIFDHVKRKQQYETQTVRWQQISDQKPVFALTIRPNKEVESLA